VRDKRVFSCELVSCVRGLIEFGCVLRVAVSSCIRELVEVIHVQIRYNIYIYKTHYMF
jgi:hypothetical protein